MAGFTTAFATVAVAGIGDKSFLTALVLAARHKARWVFTGSVLALTIGAALWIGIGVWLRSHISMDVIRVVSGTTFLAFGIKAFLDARQHHQRENTQIDRQQTAGAITSLPCHAVIRDSFTTTFLAEFGDRTQLALLALAAGPNLSTESIFTGAVSANIVLAVAAVTSGKYLKQSISHKRICLISGALFTILGLKILLTL
ncbi:hypothetical protein KR100_12415 [Synechococcus sp. KORDI-100]|uniref:TMEM165/GDT1 family protein n=1 Tax=Synechococcus sp. KORDI-100 TaxID=1280380 RepID=UPI0004E05772|nr:TMEM165/GDT1 family protein [Synechococcus sp. KORDI-100]AII44153.1 hypothetical protein KR100_12415 [Synechococcus sp. KORDI-100]